MFDLIKKMQLADLVPTGNGWFDGQTRVGNHLLKVTLQLTAGGHVRVRKAHLIPLTVANVA